MLWAMLIVWLALGKPQYVTQEGSIAYISDIGASSLKPLFIAGCSITAACFFFSLILERFFRHTGRWLISCLSSVASYSLWKISHSLVGYVRRRERILSIFAIIGSFIGGLGLILLSIFDTGRFTSAHRAFLLVFIVGVALSAIFTILEVC